jgi:AraC family transcriptional regulator
MHTLNFEANSHRPSAAAAVSRSSTVEHDVKLRGVHQERTWCCPADEDHGTPVDAAILVSRWTDPRNSCHLEEHLSPPDRHIISVSLKTVQVRLTRGSFTIFDGVMPAGTLHVTGPSRQLTAKFGGPSDFVRFHVLNDVFRKRERAARSAPSEVIADLNDLIIRDPFAELLGRTLLRNDGINDALYAESVGHTLAMHIARLPPSQQTVCALPKWRLQRVQEYIETHLEGPLTLSELASVVGLSRMHFAAQFREATGSRPHLYVLSRRIEKAKVTLLNTNMPIAEVALSVGFNAQSHFSTVFKRFTGDGPARWRRIVANPTSLTCDLTKWHRPRPNALLSPTID